MSLIPFAPFSTRPRPTSKKLASSLQIIAGCKHRELALVHAPCSRRRRSQRAVPANHRFDRKIAEPKVVFEELIIRDEIHDLLRWRDWVRAYRATAEFFDCRLAVSGAQE
jgi:hypothetical protein